MIGQLLRIGGLVIVGMAALFILTRWEERRKARREGD
jgi:hypothetical protein